MGALHNGHLSLIRKSKTTDDLTVCSIFVNPVQFNDRKDFEKYPVMTEKDLELLAGFGTEVVFLPGVKEIYPEGLDAPFSCDIGYLETVLEGLHRPGHFRGVCRVMGKLLGIVRPQDLFMGQKDYQQCLVVKHLIRQSGLAIRLHIIPTAREADGLAMSSRNMRLSPAARKKAAAIHKALTYICDNIGHTPVKLLKSQASKILFHGGFEKIDYIEICDAATLMPVTEPSGKKMAALIAASIEGVRLIDNTLIE
jgi:pantoate--beta-alanine ligase